MHLLQFAPRLCWPLDTGAKLRNFHLARVLSEAATVTLLAFKENGESPELRNVYEQVVAVPRRGSYSLGKMLRGAIGSTPLPLLNYTTSEMRAAVQRLVSDNDFDVVQIESIHLMNYLTDLRGARSRPLIVCDWHNIESELMQRYAEREKNSARRIYAQRTARLMKQAEQQAMSEFDAHITVSERDAATLRSLKPDAEVYVIENGVDPPHYSPDDSHAPQSRNRILFVGSMDYHANIDGVINFARTVWPRVHRQKPEFVFTIVGRDPAPAVRELAATEGIEITGSVDDVRPFYREAIVAVVPLKVGGGSRLKILEAMAAGVAVVSTTLGAEGLDVRDGENILLGDSDEKAVDRIIKVAEQPELRNQIIDGGLALVSSRYDWSKIGSKLADCYQQLLAKRR